MRLFKVTYRDAAFSSKIKAVIADDADDIEDCFKKFKKYASQIVNLKIYSMSEYSGEELGVDFPDVLV